MHQNSLLQTKEQQLMNNLDQLASGSELFHPTPFSQEVNSECGMPERKRPRSESVELTEKTSTKAAKTALPPRENFTVVNKNPTSVAKRNARERRRIKNVNLAFDELRERVPSGEQNKKKISKVETLQLAIEYIKVLEDLVSHKKKVESTSNFSDENNGDNISESSNECIGIADSPLSYNSDLQTNTRADSDNSILEKCSTDTKGQFPTKCKSLNSQYSGFDDSGFLENSICEKFSIQNSTYPVVIDCIDNIPAKDDSALATLGEVSADDVDIFLDNSLQPTKELPLSHSNQSSYFDYQGHRQDKFTSPNAWTNYSMDIGYQHSPRPFASTPTNENTGNVFTFPPPYHTTINMPQPQFPNVAVSNDFLKSSDSYKFGNTHV